MTDLDWMTRLSGEVHGLYALLRPGALALVAVLLMATVFAGRLARRGVHVLWRLGLDTSRRLAPTGILVQLVLCCVVGVGVVGSLVRAAPMASFLLMLAFSPVVVVVLQQPLRNALAGLTLLFRGGVLEGDRVVLESGQRGVVRQIRLTSTMARTETGGRLLIPNTRLLELVLEVDRRQAGVPLALRFAVESRPDERTLAGLRRLALLSPYRAGNTLVSVDYLDEVSQVEICVRLPHQAAREAARRELWDKAAARLAGRASTES